MSRNFQFGLGRLAQTSAATAEFFGGRPSQCRHHRTSALWLMHSPVARGFLYAHPGWIFVRRNDGDRLRRRAHDLQVLHPEPKWFDQQF